MGQKYTKECPVCHSKIEGIIEVEIDLENIDEKKKLLHESMKKGSCILCGNDIFNIFQNSIKEKGN